MSATNGAGRRITVHDATIKTATVAVKALTISGKQVTLAVFEQLERETLLDPETGELRGLPWGRVNYYRKPCEPDHLHVVWQRGEDLRRDCVYERRSAETRAYNEIVHEINKNIEVLSKVYLMAEILADSEKMRHFGTYKEPPYRISGPWGWCNVTDLSQTTSLRDWLQGISAHEAERRTVPSAQSQPSFPDSSTTFYDPPTRRPETDAEWHDRLTEVREQRHVRLQATFDRVFGELEGSMEPTPDGISAAITRQFADRSQLRTVEGAVAAAYRRHYKELLALDQLFIAV